MSPIVGQYAERTGTASTAPSMVSTWIGGTDVAKVTCSIEGCEKPSVARGWCGTHWRLWRRNGAPEYQPIVHRTCSEDGCGREHAARGYCINHYTQWKRRQRPARWGRSGPRLELRRSLADRFWEKVEKTETCWNWTASLNGNGYGQFALETWPLVLRGAHRIAYLLVVGPIPEGLDLDHLCRNRRCVNPAHLEPVTRQVNLRRGTNARRRAA